MTTDQRFPGPASDSSAVDAEAETADISQLLTEIAELRREVAVLRDLVQAGTPSRYNRLSAAMTDRAVARITGPVTSFARGWRGVSKRIDRRVSALRQSSEWAPGHSLIWDAIALLVVLIIAWLIRSHDLTAIPRGLHGDEAATGLEARRIIDSGWVGVYTGSAGGNPTGFYYLDALVFRFVDDPILAVRLLSAIGGTLGVIALYVLVRRNVGFGSAVFASVLLTFSSWHIQFSRLGFVTGIWPTVVLIGTVALMEAIRTKAWYWWAAAGSCLSAGTYIYNGNGPLLVIIAAFAIWSLFGWMVVAAAACVAGAAISPTILGIALLAVAVVLVVRSRAMWDKASLMNAASLGIASLIVLKELIDFVREKPTDYFGRSRSLSVFRSDEWANQTGLIDKAGFLGDRYRGFWDKLTFHPIPDGVDLSGITAVVPTITLAVFTLGLVLALLRRPAPLTLFAVLIVLAAPLISALTDLTLRRALVIAPFLAILGGIGILELWRIAFRFGKPIGFIAGAGLMAMVVRSSYVNYTDYFDTTIASGPAQHTLATDLRQTAEFIKELPADTYIYFYCDRWVLEYDVVRLIAPDAKGENRAPKWGGSGTFEIDHLNGTPVFLLMGNYTSELSAVQAMYPGGSVITGQLLGPPLNGPAFVAYILPGDQRVASP